MALSLSKNLAPCMLILTSAHGLSRLSRHFYYARAAFKLYIVCGCVLLAQSLAQDQDLSLAIQTSWIWCYCLGLPLISAELGLQRLPCPTTHSQLIVPLYSVIGHYGPCSSPVPDNPCILGVSHIYSITSLTILSVAEQDLTYLKLAICYFYSLFRHVGYGVIPLVYHYCRLIYVSFLNYFQILLRSILPFQSTALLSRN
ncbi:hypothetical protein O3M35_002922 [Rhynocoris fuscipes]|uniref:Uncharacterized protein n=1 Tax=Rhynocoris fuscipes TaxID=488301 RepID=A0AAW1CTY8_9HEMI